MLFEKVRIKNVFSYYGEVVFDLSRGKSRKNIVIISGRNGYGKTSFINSLKLLFMGPDEELRSSVATGRAFSSQEYLLGNGPEWQGALNRVARGEQSPNDYFVELVWREDAGLVTVRRSWQINDNKAIEVLTVEAEFANKIVNGEEAQDFLNRRLPKHVLPYFIYDAEQVQRLAEANRQSQMQQIERLLDLAAVDSLDEYLDKNIVEWRRQGLAPQEQVRLQQFSAELALQIAENEQDQLKRQDLLDHISACDHEAEKISRFLDSMRAYALQRDEADFKRRHYDLRSKLEELCQDLFERLSREAPLLANPSLVSIAYELTRQSSKDAATMLSQEIKALFAKLPAQLLDDPPHPNPSLTQSQRDFYKSKLQRLSELLALGTRPANSLMLTLTPSIAEPLVSRLNYFKEAKSDRARIASDLRAVSEMKRQLAELDARLDDISHLADSERISYRDRKRQMEEVQAKRDSLNRELGKVELELSRRKGAIDSKRREIREQESKVQEGKDLSLRVELARRLQAAFRVYRQGLKDRRRKQIEVALNERFHQLMSSHRLIAKIGVSDTFALEYLDEKGELIGLASISAGMKQLVAQSLLWALKDVAGKTAPLVIDTPLARIDRRNQDNLLQKYFPKAGDQVIILPTDSEVDERKYRLLRPHIYREYRLENPTGERTQVIEAPMYTLEA